MKHHLLSLTLLSLALASATAHGQAVADQTAKGADLIRLEKALDTIKKTSSKIGNKKVNLAKLIPKRENVKIPFDRTPIKDPVFKKAEFNILEHGAQGDGKFLNTKAFQQAITACHQAGGGKVVVPAGKWLTGPIHLKSNVNLNVTKGAEIIFSSDWKLYPEVLVRWQGIECYNISPFIYAKDCENFALTGKGIINGNGKNWWSWRKKQHGQWKDLAEKASKGIPVPERREAARHRLRPQLLLTYGCKNVLIEGVTILGGAFWTVCPVYCENFIARDIYIETRGPNNDGINIDSCKNVLIESCYFDCANDNICIKSGLNEDGWRVNKPCENILVRYCVMRRGYGGIVVGSEISGGVNKLFAHDCIIDGNENGIRIKTRAGRGSFVKDLHFDHIVMGQISHYPIIVTAKYSTTSTTLKDDSNKKLTQFSHFTFTNISSRSGKEGINVQGEGQKKIQHLTFKSIWMTDTKNKRVSNAEHVVFDNVHFNQTK